MCVMKNKLKGDIHMDLDRSIQRNVFRLKDLLSSIQNKQLHIRIFYNGEEINYDDMLDYKDYYVVDIGLGEDEGNPSFMIFINTSVDIVYIPNV